MGKELLKNLEIEHKKALDGIVLKFQQEVCRFIGSYTIMGIGQDDMETKMIEIIAEASDNKVNFSR